MENSSLILFLSLVIGIQWRNIVYGNIVSSVAKRMNPPKANGCGYFIVQVCLPIFLLPFYVWYKTDWTIPLYSFAGGMIVVNTILAIIERILGVPGNFPMDEINSHLSWRMDLWCGPIVENKKKFNLLLIFYFIYPIIAIALSSYIVYKLW